MRVASPIKLLKVLDIPRYNFKNLEIGLSEIAKYYKNLLAKYPELVQWIK